MKGDLVMHNIELWSEIEKQAYELFSQDEALQDLDGTIFAYKVSEKGHKEDIFYMKNQVNDEQLRALGFDPVKCRVEYLFSADLASHTLHLATQACLHPDRDDTDDSCGRTTPLYVVICGPNGPVEKTFQAERKGNYFIVVSDDGFDGKRVKADYIGTFVDNYFGFSDAAISRNSMEEARHLWNAGVSSQIEALGEAIQKKKALLVARQ